MFVKTMRDDKLSLLLTLIFSALCLLTAYRSMSMIAEVLLFIVLGIVYFKKSSIKEELNQREKLFIFAFIGFFVSALTSWIVGSGWELRSVRNPSMPSLIDLDLPSKYLLGALVFLLCVRLKWCLSPKVFGYAIGLGAMVNGCIAIYQHYQLGYSRVYGWSGIAEMAEASALLAVLNLVLFVFASCKKERIFYFVAIFLACLACIFSGTRGSILGFVVTFLFVGVMIFWKKRELLPIFFVGVLAGGLAFVPSLTLEQRQDTMRFDSAENDLKQYMQGNAHTSIGMRFEMWKEAIVMFQMAPFFGLTSAEIEKKMPEILQRSGSALVGIKKANPNNDARGKKHNQILNQAAKKGIVGVIALLLVWFASFRLFTPFLNTSGNSLIFSFCGVSILFYLIFPSLVGEPWESNVTLPLVTLLICAFYKIQKGQKIGY
ncbi:hypothetical protein BBW65_06335 [Helicobacter enhydrae]|uniref:O-antigen ligase-related domain-containing protein n=1 Tax=Helicobacter enhydrae TaxID=222136 RepID=A0A1B1U6S4_9HELI|nr:O-antigen ligase family protein [Helicobacter enhydrae]ANV98436.1 hypothetical protein BBW65_06335 [Helicobacter enhydrae]